MKPHEASLSIAPFDSEHYCIIEDGGRMVAIMRTVDAEEWERFILGTPFMARALLDIRHALEANQLDKDGTLELIDHVLHFAKVLP
jgi:hypothetical protein